MQEPDKNRMLNFLIGNENVHDFESWVYSDTDLESRIGAELYFELIEPNYGDKNVLYNLRKVVLGNYISQNEFESFKYKRFLQDSGWYQDRSIELDLSKAPNTPEIKNAVKIIEEYGGLKFISPEERENWTLTLVEFLEAPARSQNMKGYGLNKNLVCFATAHNDHINLFVDENNKFYQLDNVVGENLYEYKGLDFEHMMRELLELGEKDNFQKVGSKPWIPGQNQDPGCKRHYEWRMLAFGITCILGAFYINFQNLITTKSSLTDLKGTIENAHVIVDNVSSRSRMGYEAKSRRATLYFRLNEHRKLFKLFENIEQDYAHEEYEGIAESLNNSNSVTVWINKSEFNNSNPKVFQIEVNKRTILDFNSVKAEHTGIFIFMLLFGTGMTGFALYSKYPERMRKILRLK